MKSEKKSEKLNKREVVEANIVEKKNKKSETKKEKKVDSKVKKTDENQKKNKETKVKKTKGEGFFKEVIKELKRVKWPDKKYMAKYSTATFVAIIVSSLYFYAIFALFSYLKGLR